MFLSEVSHDPERTSKGSATVLCGHTKECRWKEVYYPSLFFFQLFHQTSILSLASVSHRAIWSGLWRSFKGSTKLFEALPWSLKILPRFYFLSVLPSCPGSPREHLTLYPSAWRSLVQYRHAKKLKLSSFIGCRGFSWHLIEQRHIRKSIPHLCILQVKMT